jgi:3-dehydroquinate dehydratase-2
VAHILVVHGPNLNMLGKREQQIYGQTSLEEINVVLCQYAQQEGHEIDIVQSNHEGELVDCIQQRGARADVLIMNPAAYTHTPGGVYAHQYCHQGCCACREDSAYRSASVQHLSA